MVEKKIKEEIEVKQYLVIVDEPRRLISKGKAPIVIKPNDIIYVCVPTIEIAEKLKIDFSKLKLYNVSKDTANILLRKNKIKEIK